MRSHFTAGSVIGWNQYRAKGETVSVVRTGIVWADAPKFEGCAGAHVWVIPDERYPGENSAIAVRVHRGGRDRGTAEVFEDSPAYRDHSLREVTKL